VSGVGLAWRAPGLLAALMAAVRPEFRADVLEFDPADAVFGGALCQVAECGRTARGRGLCQGHGQRWRDQGHLDLAGFIASTDPRWARERPNAVCKVSWCGYGSARAGLCVLHGQRWERGGRPDLESWLAAVPAVTQPVPGAVCLIEPCLLWPQATSRFCHTHHATWRVNGRGDPQEFARRFLAPDTFVERERIDLTGLGTGLRLEIQYVLQCRGQDRGSKTSAAMVMRVVRFLAAEHTASLLERDEDSWRARVAASGARDSNARALLLYGYRKVSDLAAGEGWEAEYPHEVWHLRRLGYPGNNTLDFRGIAQPWLSDLAKQWIRWRLGTGLHLEVSRRAVRALTRLSRFLATAGITGIDGLDRAVLERYLAHLSAELRGNHQQGVHIGQLAVFFDAIRQHQWAPDLPASCHLFAEDFPKRAERPPRALAEQIMGQVEEPRNLERFGNPAYQLATVILIRAGLRVTDALSLEDDCVVTDADAAPYLRYFNRKMKRQALVPIDEEVRAMIGHQQERNLQRWPDGISLLFPRPTKNPDGRAPTSSSTYRLALYRWLERCEVRDENGRPARLTPHQWRHTLGTRLINRDVPQEVVRRILDHDSAQMTAHYARLHDTTVRRHWEKARKVDITGTTVTLDPAGALSDAAWAKQRLGRATQALPNGYCGLPIQKTCPHANACLTCPMFITTPEFLPQHRAQRQELLQIIDAATAQGHTRQAEMNQQIADNLTTVINSLETDTREEHGHAA
jgi:integrase